jgi:hypothetical protein
MVLAGQGGEVVATLMGIFLVWFAVSVVTALVVGRLVHHSAKDRLEEFLAAESPDLSVLVSIALGQPSAEPKSSSANF